jgi:Putative transposase
MSERAAHLVDSVLPRVPVRQWVLTVPHGLRYGMAHDPSLMAKVLNVFVRAICGWLKRRARKLRIAGPFKTGAVTVIQRFDSALALNVHFHSVVLDGVYALDHQARPIFHPTPPPTDADVAAVATTILRRVHALVNDDGDPDATSALAACTSASITRVAATGARRGSPLRRIIGQRPPPARILGRRCAQIEGFNLHANTRVAANERDQLETLCRYLARPPLPDERLTPLPDSNLALRLKRPWSDGTTHLILSPTELIERLIPLVPRPRAHLTRYHGVLAPAAGWRSQVVPASTVPRKRPACADASQEAPSPAARRWTPWVELLKRVFLIDALACPRCPGRMRVIAVVMRKSAIESILNHLGLANDVSPSNPPRGSPQDAVKGAESRDAIDWPPNDEFPA